MQELPLGHFIEYLQKNPYYQNRKIFRSTFSDLGNTSVSKLVLKGCSINIVLPYSLNFSELNNLTVLDVLINGQLYNSGLRNQTKGLNTTTINFIDASGICVKHRWKFRPKMLKVSKILSSKY